MNFNLLREQLLKAVRGPISQADISQKLGFSFNQVYRWEKGITKITWCQFAKLAKACNIDIDHALKQLLYDAADLDALNTPKILSILIGEHKLNEVAKLLGVSRFIISRWFSGKVDPPLEQVLKIWSHYNSSFINFLDQLIDISNIPIMEPYFKKQKGISSLFLDFPYAGAALWSFNIKDYLSKKIDAESLLIRTLGISKSKSQELIKRLLKLELIETKDGIYQPTLANLNTYRIEPKSLKAIGRHYLIRAQEINVRTDGIPNKDKSLMGYLEFNVTEDMKQQLIEMYMNFYTSIQALAAGTENDADDVMVFTMQLFQPGYLNG